MLDVVRWTTARFAERGLGSPRLDAELLVAHVLSLPRVQLYVQFERVLSPEELAALRALIKRRQGGESVAYLTGRKEFWKLEFAVDARVLVPRPDTETLVEEALSRLGAPDEEQAEAAPEQAEAAPEQAEAAGEKAEAAGEQAEAPGEQAEAAGEQGENAAKNAEDAEEAEAAGAAEAPPIPSPREAGRGLGRGAPRIADVGTGSGALAITLAKLRPGAVVVASDASAPALEVARANAERHGAAVTFVEGDLGAPLAAHAPFSLIVANLPYIPTGELASLPADVRSEPASALDGGADGLELVRRLVAEAPALLAAGGVLALEIGDGQAAATRALLEAAGFTDVQARRDLAGTERVVSGTKR
ncbi:MAG TPA: HemK/PrmC family methyltransferase [Polyangia bacterium]